MISLGIDTSNYATSVSIVDIDGRKILYNKKIFLPVDEGKIGLRQQEALFHHIKNLDSIFSEDIDLSRVYAIGVSSKPKSDENSYMPCFLRGKMCAKTVAKSLDKPVFETSHQTGHLTSALYYLNNEKLYNRKILMMHVSGGTTDIVLAENGEVIKTLGSSLDLFAGQAIDRLGVKLGFPFPAGVYVSRLAAKNTEKIKNVKISVKECDCNLSGLENICDRLLACGSSKEYVCAYCLEFISSTLSKMIKNAQNAYGNLPVVMAGGVMSSEYIKNYFSKYAGDISFVDPVYSRDNAIGVAVYAARKVING